MTSIGESFANAIAAKDADTLLAVLSPSVDFRAMTPNKLFEASSATEIVHDVILGRWFEPSDHIESLEATSYDAVGDCNHVGYRLQVRNGDGLFTVEQQAYYETDGDRITWLRIMCAGYRPVAATA
jgi:hypothetical protein